jgi:hypothetical protein
MYIVYIHYICILYMYILYIAIMISIRLSVMVVSSGWVVTPYLRPLE